MRIATAHPGQGKLYERNGTKVTAGGTSPTLRRRELGFLLRKLRNDRGLSAEEASRLLLFSPTKLSRLETGRAGASPRDIRDLCNLYEVTDPAERERLMSLAREGKQRAWWQSYGLPYATYVGLEAEAVSISNYESSRVSGLFQVEGYARAIIEAFESDPATVEQHVEARMKRQDLLASNDGPSFRCILDEAALRRPVGGPGVMREQLERIIEIAARPNVAFQIIPLDAGAHPAMGYSFVVLEFEEPMVNDVVYLEGMLGDLYIESAEDLERYKQIFALLSSIALNEGESIAAVTSIAATYD
jgi:transcriptional regulator with XRE-family HTH domain